MQTGLTVRCEPSVTKKCYRRRVRIAVVKIHELCSDEKPTYRLCESDGSVCDCWLPGLEPPEPEPLDFGGFDQRLDAEAFALGIDYERALDAEAFALGIDYERALFGLLPGVTVEDVDAERHQLDSMTAINRANSRKTLDSAALDRMDAAPQIDLEALWDAVSEPAAPVVTHRRRVA
jgi:hypothetical protein